MNRCLRQSISGRIFRWYVSETQAWRCRPFRRSEVVLTGILWRINQFPLGIRFFNRRSEPCPRAYRDPKESFTRVIVCLPDLHVPTCFSPVARSANGNGIVKGSMFNTNGIFKSSLPFVTAIPPRERWITCRRRRGAMRLPSGAAVFRRSTKPSGNGIFATPSGA